MAASTKDILSPSTPTIHVQMSDKIPVAMGPSKSASSRSPISHHLSKLMPISSPCAAIVCCDADHSARPAVYATDCHDCSTSAPSSPCSDIHHISSTCTEPSCGAATSSSTAVVCPTAVACCDDTSCADAPVPPCSQSACSAPDDCSSMTLAVPVISTCCTDESCEPDAATHADENGVNVCDGIIQPKAEARAHFDNNAHKSHNECRECRGSLTATGTAEGGQLYSSFQELLDCCCCSMPPTADQCCVGSTPYPCHVAHPSPADTMSPALQSSHHRSRTHPQHTALPPPPPPAPLSDTPSSSIITNATQHTSPGSRNHAGSRASTVSTTATPQPMAPSPSSALPWSSSLLHPPTPQFKDKFGGASAFDSHHSSPVAAAVSFEDILTELQSWNDCTFEQPHLHSSQGGCLPPAMTLCNSDICQTSAPHSHWMPNSSLQQQQPQQHQQQSSGAMPQDARPQLCQWAGCNERFWTVEELVAHVNHSHLARRNASADSAQAAMINKSFLSTATQPDVKSAASAPDLPSSAHQLECLWNDCHQVPMPEALEVGGAFTPTTESDLWKSNATHPAVPAGQDDKVSLAILQHLLHDHLGQHFAAPFSLNGTSHLAPPATCSPLHGEAAEAAAAAATALSSSVDSASTSSTWSKKRKSSDTSSSSNNSSNDAYCSETEKLYCRWQGCSAHFDSHSSLTDHIETVHVGSGKAEYECRWIGCARHASGVKFSQKQKVLRHIQTHTGDRPFKCSECGKRFSEQNTLAQHMRTHTLERPYVCDHPGCGKAFSVAGSLTIHKRIHTGSKPFVCSFPGCGKAFAESSNLTKHVRTHTGDKPFRCTECGKCFSRPDQASRHRKTHERKRGKLETMGKQQQQQGTAVGLS